MNHPVATIRCAQHGAHVVRYLVNDEQKAVEVHLFFVTHARCMLVSQPRVRLIKQGKGHSWRAA